MQQELDLTKPHWTLRVVSDQSTAASFDLTKDTERLDQINAMKKAWEMAEPGRQAKVTKRLRTRSLTLIISFFYMTYDLSRPSQQRQKWFCLGFTVSSQVSESSPTPDS